MLRLGGKGKKPAKAAAKGRMAVEIRLQQEFDQLELPQSCVVDFPNSDDLMHFNIRITPDIGFWKGCTYHFSFDIPLEYPYTTPKVKCQTKIYHPNIDLEGNICLNILRDDWTPVQTIAAVIFGLLLLLDDPNANDPLNHQAAALLRKDRGEFAQVVRRTLRGEVYEGVRFPRLM